jgi:hypothetical protein
MTGTRPKKPWTTERSDFWWRVVIGMLILAGVLWAAGVIVQVVAMTLDAP